MVLDLFDSFPSSPLAFFSLKNYQELFASSEVNYSSCNVPSGFDTRN